MKLDPILKSAIQEACENEGVPQTSQAVTRLLERYVTKEIPDSQIASSLQGIYELFKDRS